MATAERRRAARRGLPVLLSAIVLLCAAPARAQETGEPATPPIRLLTDFDFHLSIEQVGSDDPQFVWDADYGGDIDLLDYGVGRVNFLANYEAILGEEFRRFDPNQGIYTLDVSSSYRTEPAELALVFHHISRHLSDRSKKFAIDWNMVGIQAARVVTLGPTSLDLRGHALWTLKRSFVDYRADYGGTVRVRHPIRSGLAVVGAGDLAIMTIDPTVLNRPTQRGGRLEAGIRIEGPGAAAEFFVAYERRIDAGPFDIRPRSWGLVGFRLLSR